MEHPAKLVAEPQRVADYIDTVYEIYFEERICVTINGNQQPVVGLLGVCPVTGYLMNMEPFYPICWIIIKRPAVHEAWVRYVMEKEMLCSITK